jgi:CheY-like chemotaxis protein
LECLHREHFDCVLMDVQMPEMDGLEASRQIRSTAALAGLPIIAMTANAFKEDREQCLAAGMNDFVSKPMQPEQLYAVIARCLLAGGDARPDLHDAAAPAMPQDARGELDMSDLYERMGQDRAKAVEFVRKFVAMVRDEIGQAEYALLSENRDALASWAHHWRSPAFMVGAWRLVKLCEQMEAAQDENWGAIGRLVAELHPALERIEKELDEVMEE